REFRYRLNLDIDDLVDSIRKDGQLIPIVVRQQDDKFQLISGFRRIAALRALGQKKVQAKILYGISDVGARRISLLENLERNSLSAWDQVAAAERFRAQGMKNAEIAEAFRVSIRTVQRYLLVGKAPDDFRRALERDDITIQQAYEALKKGVPLSELLKHGRSVRYLRGLSHKSEKKDNVRIQRKADGEILINIRYRPGKSDLSRLFEMVRKKLSKT
ncbi:MAG: ParB/RepB/Spo0J family partition protein, partial [Planctomycetota bacterium]